VSRVGRRLGSEASDLRGETPPAKSRHERSFLAQQQLLLFVFLCESITTAKSLKNKTKVPFRFFFFFLESMNYSSNLKQVEN
jgi:hypothetical protein